MFEKIIELGLLRPDQVAGDDTVHPLRRLVDRLLSLISDVAVESESLKTSDFRHQIEEFRSRLLDEEEDDSFESLAQECVDVCQDFYKRSIAYVTEREAEYGELIDLLREAMGTLVGESNTLNVRLLSSSQKFTRLAELDDIRLLKFQLVREVSELKNVVAEKMKQEEAYFSKLSRRVEVLQSKLSKTKEEALLDPLTKLFNRRSFDPTIQQWIASHQRSRTPFVLAMLDLDDFKPINDNHGHLVGDRVLFCAAQWLAGSVRTVDFLVRFGGEEFALLLENMTLEQAEPRIRQLVNRIATSHYQYDKDNRVLYVRFTLSCGLTEFVAGDSPEGLIQRADEALYEAKRRGKNRVVSRK